MNTFRIIEREMKLYLRMWYMYVQALLHNLLVDHFVHEYTEIILIK